MYGSTSDSAVYYFNKGWEQILDLGQWTLAEESFRKAASLDSNFLIGKSLVGRISGDLEERQEILKELKEHSNEVDDDSKLLLDIFMSNISLMNLREDSLGTSPEARTTHRALAEANFRAFTKKYPEESYIKAEYIETIHALYGPKAALDSIRALASEKQVILPFYRAYKASLWNAMGNHHSALTTAQAIEATFNDPSIPQQHVLFAEIYLSIDSLGLAKERIEKAVELDPKHLIALGLKNQIIQEITED